MKKKLALTITSIALVAAMAIGGTFAWLTAKSDTVTNTFIASAGITALTLDESEYKDGALTSERVQANSYTMIPGETYPKDPKVTIETAVDSYVFVQVAEQNGLADYIDYAIQDGWTELETGVYYQTVTAETATADLYVLAGAGENANGQVTVKNVDLSGTSAANPALVFNAYAIQTAGFETPADAWAAALDAAQA